MYAQLRERASRAAEPCMHDPHALAAAKRYTETVLTPLLLSAPMIARAYQKPLGYPGDYQVMLYYYADAFEGDTAFAKLFHKLFVQHPLSAGVCTRKDYVIECMKGELARHTAASRGTFAVTSLGCGPAKDVSGFIDAQQSWEPQIHFRLIDQETETLQVAFEGAQRALAHSGSRGVVECLNLSFGQLLKSPKLLERGGPQHFIYSTGLFDYLNTPTAQQLIATLYDCLTPGGQMLIANAKGPNHYFFCPEFVLDWSLIYRTREEMEELARVLPSDAAVDIELESGGAYWFLKVRRAVR
jgi:extracellular factor (EF) 3-hydroxypalmitic acid methyl ester biosynthesis protein